MVGRGRVSHGLAALQAADLIVTQVSSRYGDAHLDHLGVPRRVRPLLPLVKAGAVIALIGTANRPRWRSVTGAALVAYYSAAATFHVLSHDELTDVAPAAACGLLAAAIV